MTIQTIVNTFVAFGGLRVLEEGLKYVVKNVKQKIGAKKYDKMVNTARVVVKNVVQTLNDTGATATLGKIKDASLNQLAGKTGLPYTELDKFVDVIIEEIKDIILEASNEENKVTVTDTTTNTTTTQQTPVQ